MSDQNPHLNLATYLLGFAVNEFMVQLEDAWFAADEGDGVPKRLDARLNELLSTLDQLHPDLAKRPKAKARRVEEHARQSMDAIRSAWMGRDHLKLLSLLDDIRPKGLSTDHRQSVSPLSLAELTKLRRAAACLHDELKQTHHDLYATGSLMSQTLNLHDGLQNESEGASFPVAKLEQSLARVKANVKALRPKDLALFPTGGEATRSNLRRIQERAQQLHERITLQLRKAIQQPRRRMSGEEINLKVASYLETDPKASQRKIAGAIGCSHGAVGNTDAWKRTMKWRRQNSQAKKKAVSLSPELLVMTESDELQRLIDQSNRDNAEYPSPFDKEAKRQPRERKEI